MKIEILGVAVDSMTMAEAVSLLSDYTKARDSHMVVTPNGEILLMCAENPVVCDAVSKASFVAPDGVSVLYAANALGTPIKEKLSGCELGYNLLSEISKRGGSVYLFGAKPGVAALAADRLSKQLSGLKIAGVRDGYFKPEDTDGIIDSINNSDADVLLVCLGAPKQELWMSENRDRLKVGVMMGLGGSIDVYAGIAKRAPKAFIDLKLEWLYRLLKQPQRLGRMIKIPRVIIAAKKEAKRRKNNA